MSILTKMGMVLILCDTYRYRHSEPYDSLEFRKEMENKKKVRKAQALGGSKANASDRLNQSNIAKAQLIEKFNDSRARLTRM